MLTRFYFILLGLLLSACSTPPPAGSIAVANIYPTKGYHTRSTVVFYDEPDNKMRIVARISGLTPGPHGFHVHEVGDCSDPKAMSAGGHYNPDHQPHGHYHENAHHRGDLPNLHADQEGEAALTHILTGHSFTQSGFANRSIIIHAGEDDYHSQPAGNSGERVGCGVIRVNPSSRISPIFSLGIFSSF